MTDVENLLLFVVGFFLFVGKHK